MSATMLRIILFGIALATAGGEYAAIHGTFDQAYYSLVHPGCANTHLGPDRFLCPPQQSDARKFFNGIWFPPKQFSRNGCLVQGGPQPDVEIDPVGSNWVHYTGCRFAEIMTLSDLASKANGYTKLSDHTATDDYCPLWITIGDYGHCN